MKKFDIKTQQNLALILLAIAAASITGCSSQTMYESAKLGAENNCRNQPSSEADRCLENLNKKPYEEYEKGR